MNARTLDRLRRAVILQVRDPQLTERDLASRLGVSERTIRNYRASPEWKEYETTERDRVNRLAYKALIADDERIKKTMQEQFEDYLDQQVHLANECHTFAFSAMQIICRVLEDGRDRVLNASTEERQKLAQSVGRSVGELSRVTQGFIELSGTVKQRALQAEQILEHLEKLASEEQGLERN